jgi:Ca2+-binding EF-hand superfamily protein
MKECFDAFDVNKNGSLEIAEMKEAIAEMGMEMQSERLLKMVEECDLNGDNEL